MKNLRTIIVDDEPLARELLRKYACAEGLDVIAECSNGFDGLKAIQEMRPDLVFLDVQMPRIDGFELLELLDNKPHIIFATAFDQYAIRAFEMNAVDYLLKPFSKERFLQALSKVGQRIQLQQPQPLEKLQQQLDNQEHTLDRVVVRVGSKIIIIPVEKIYYFEAQDDYVLVCSELGRHLKEKTMKYFEEHLPGSEFLRIHRKYIINITCATSVDLYEKNTHLVVMKNGDKLRASQEGYKRLRETFR
ncbi:MAG TPA: response regulator [Bacteroidales bacterium]|nr:response regulator [Bacteroidales bacterium]